MSNSFQVRAWRRSQHSTDSGTNCVEVAAADGAVVIRDSTQAAQCRTPVLSISAVQWRHTIEQFTVVNLHDAAGS